MIKLWFDNNLRALNLNKSNFLKLNIYKNNDFKNYKLFIHNESCKQISVVIY